ncbi:MAG: methylenetetrahydrofolate reductase [Alphaproteobacteria bacterium]
MPDISFEVFPGRGRKGRFLNGLARLQAESPDYISITYGADDEGRARSEQQVRELLDSGPVENLTPHLTCIGQPRVKIKGLAQSWIAKGVRSFVALRGDGSRSYPDEIGDSAELVSCLRAWGADEVAVGCYPTGHVRSSNIDDDIQAVKLKQESGATRAISQFFFNPDDFLRYRDRAVAAGVSIPVVPGVLLVKSADQLDRFARRCGAPVPDWVYRQYDGIYEEDPATALLSATTAISLIQRLSREGVSVFHLYTLNQFDSAVAVSRAVRRDPYSLCTQHLKEAA